MAANLMILLGIVIFIAAYKRAFRSPLEPRKQPPWSLLAVFGVGVTFLAGWLYAWRLCEVCFGRRPFG